MRSNFELNDIECGWCEKKTTCVIVQMGTDSRLDLCWSCLKKKVMLKAKNNSTNRQEASAEA